METKQNYQDRAQFILKKAIVQEPKLSDRVGTFYSEISKKVQPEQSKSSMKHAQTFQVQQVHRMGSLSNEVYKVTLKNGNVLIVKHYFDVLREFVQRNIQHEILDVMTEKKEYPYVFYKDHFCRVEAYIPGSSITRQQLTPKLLKRITESLATFSKKYEHITKNKQLSSFRQIPNLIKVYRDIYKNKMAQNPELVQKVRQFVEGILDNKQILSKLQTLLKSHKMIMNHNDSNLSNILVLNFVQSQYPDIQLLDFEFSNLNYIGYDLGNLLNEIATDYGGAYGMDETGKQHKFEIRQDWQIDQQTVKDITNLYFDMLEDKSKLQDRLRCVKIGRMLSHLFWLFVGLKQIDDPNIDLNMVYYVKRRYEQFMKLYKELI